MPFRLLDLDGVANYLHLTPADIEQRVKNREIPFEKRGDRIVFRQREIDAWASQRILGLPGQHLTDYHQKSTRHTRKNLPQEAILPELLRSGAIASAMTSKTKASLLRDLVALAEKTGSLGDPKALLASLERAKNCVPRRSRVDLRCHTRGPMNLTCLRLPSSWWGGRSRKSILARPMASRRICSSCCVARMTGCIFTRWPVCASSRRKPACSTNSATRPTPKPCATPSSRRNRKFWPIRKHSKAQQHWCIGW